MAMPKDETTQQIGRDKRWAGHWEDVRALGRSMARVYAPLHDFRWPGHQFEIADDLVISNAQAPEAENEAAIIRGKGR